MNALKGLESRIRAGPVVMVAKNGVGGRLEIGEGFDGRVQVVAAITHIIAGEGDQVGILSVDEFHDLPHMARFDPAAEVDIADLGDAEALLVGADLGVPESVGIDFDRFEGINHRQTSLYLKTHLSPEWIPSVNLSCNSGHGVVLIRLRP